jgi:hypothetical protein
VQLPDGMAVKILGVRPPHKDDSMPWYAPDGNGEVKMPYQSVEKALLTSMVY